MNKRFLTVLTLLPLLFTFAACSDDDSDFAGRDNHIIAFELTTGGVTYKGAVTGDQIIMAVPEGLSLKGATAGVVLSENASISPDPAGITDWDAEEQFVVTSYNNERRSYIYRLNRTAVSTSGNVTLLTQEEVDAFAATGVSVIDGNLTVGKTNGTTAADTIRDLTGLSNIVQVVHNITINNTYGGEDLSGLSNIKKTGGLTIGTVQSLTSIAFPGLKSVGRSVSIGSVTAKEIRMPQLEYVGENFSVKSDSMNTAVFGQLKEVEGDMLFNGSNGTATNNRMTSVSFPLLERVGGTLALRYWASAEKLDVPVLGSVGGEITLTHWNKADGLSFPVLGSAGGLSISTANLLEEVDLPRLHTLNGLFSVATLLNLSYLELPELQSVSGAMTLNGGALSEVYFPELESVGGTLSIPSGASNLTTPRFPKLRFIGTDLDIRNTKVPDLGGFPALEEIGARLYLYNATGFTSFEGAPALKKVGRQMYLYGLTNLTGLDLAGITVPTLYMYGLTALGEVNVKGAEVGSIDIYGTTWTNLKVTGDDVFEGRVYLSSPPSGAASMPAFEGFREIGTLEVSTGSFAYEVSLQNVEVVKGQLNFTSSNSTKVISMPSLRSAGGIQFNYNNSLERIDMPMLETITGYTNGSGVEAGGFNYPVSSNIQQVNLPMLTTVKGDFAVTNIQAAAPITGINAPSLRTVEGILNITGRSGNTAFSDLGNFTGLTSANGVTISGFTNLVSFEGLKNAMKSFETDGWKVSGNGYNPSYRDMLDGNYTKP